MNKELLTTNETMALLGISRSKLHTLACKGLLRPRDGLTRGNLYLRSEINLFLQNLPVKESYLTAEEIRNQHK